EERVSMHGEAGLGEEYETARARLIEATAEQERIRSRAAAAKLLTDQIAAARERAYASYREPLRRAITAGGSIVFGPTFDVELDDDLSVTGRALAQRSVPWSSLSSGAREQLAVLTGLAVASVASDGGVPLVLDDTLGYTDPDRLESLGAVLAGVD